MTTARRQIVILGGGYGGLMSALRLAGKMRRERPEITLVNGSATFVERIRLHQVAAEQQGRERSISGLLKGTGVGFVQGWVRRLDAAAQRVLVETADGVRELAYDYLVYGLGSFPDVTTTAGVREHGYTLSASGARSAAALGAELPAVAAAGGRLLVVGGGLSGIEAAAELAERYPGLRVTLATRGGFGEALSAAGRAHVRQVLERLGVTVRDQCTIQRVEAGAAVCGDGERLGFERLLWTAGFSVPEVAREAGLTVNKHGQIVVDGYLRSVSHPTIVAVGDSAAAAPQGVTLRMACATALPMGAQAADYLAAVLRDETPTPFRFGYLIRCVSLGRGEGLVQTVDSYDQPRARILRGRRAVWIKELICRSTVYGLLMERYWPGSYWWPQPQLKAAAASVGQTSYTEG